MVKILKNQDSNVRLLYLRIFSTTYEILDTKWKYQSKVTPDDLRQLYAYLHYFESHQGYLLYPDKETKHVRIESGDFWAVKGDEPDERSCGLMFADLIVANQSNRNIGKKILKKVRDTSEPKTRPLLE